MKKFILILLLVGLFLVGWSYYTNSTKEEATKPPPAAIQTFSVSQRVIWEIGPTLALTQYEVTPGETALQLLERAQVIKTNGSGENAFVVQIGQRLADEKKKEYWSFYVNGQPAQVGAGSYKLTPGDTIEWKIETY